MQRNKFTRYWVILILPLIHLGISLSKHFKYSFYWIQLNNNLFSRDVKPCHRLIPDVSEHNSAFIFRVKQFEKRRLFLHCLTINLLAPLTQWQPQHLKTGFFSSFAVETQSLAVIWSHVLQVLTVVQSSLKYQGIKKNVDENTKHNGVQWYLG